MRFLDYLSGKGGLGLLLLVCFQLFGVAKQKKT